MTESAVPISRQRAVIGAISSVSSHAINIGVLIWLQRHLLSEVPLEEYALLPLVQAPLAIVPIISMTFAAGVGRFVVKAYASDDPGRVTTIVSSITPYLAAASGVVLILGGILTWQIEAVLDFSSRDLIGDAQWMIALLVSGTAVRITLGPLTLGPYARQRFVLISAMELGGQAFRLVLLLFLLFGVSQRVIWVVVATVASETILLFVKIAVSRFLAPELKVRRAAFDRNTARELIRFGSWTAVRRIADLILLVVTPILLRNMGSAQAVAIYHLATLPGLTLRRFALRALSPLSPPIVAMHVRNEPDRIRAAFMNGNRYALWATTFVCVPLISLREPTLALYLHNTPLTPASVELALLLCLTMPLIEFAMVMTGMVANAIGKERPVAIATVIHRGGALVLVVTFVLLGWGAIGAVLGSWIGVMVLRPMVSWPLGLRIAKAGWGEWFGRSLVPGFAPALAGAVVWAPIGVWVPIDSWLELAAAFFAGAIVFGVVLYLRGLTASERRDLHTLVGKLRRLSRS